MDCHEFDNKNRVIWKTFLKCGININLLDNNGKNILFHAIQSFHSHSLQILFDVLNKTENLNPLFLNHTDHAGRSALFLSILKHVEERDIFKKKYGEFKKNDKYIYEILLSNGANPNILDRKTNITCLGLALKTNNWEIASALIEAGVVLTTKDISILCNACQTIDKVKKKGKHSVSKYNSKRISMSATMTKSRPKIPRNLLKDIQRSPLASGNQSENNEDLNFMKLATELMSIEEEHKRNKSDNRIGLKSHERVKRISKKAKTKNEEGNYQGTSYIAETIESICQASQLDKRFIVNIDNNNPLHLACNKSMLCLYI